MDMETGSAPLPDRKLITSVYDKRLYDSFDAVNKVMKYFQHHGFKNVGSEGVRLRPDGGLSRERGDCGDVHYDSDGGRIWVEVKHRDLDFTCAEDIPRIFHGDPYLIVCNVDRFNRLTLAQRPY